MDVSDGATFLDAALASLASQTFQDFEIVLCAHGATDAIEALIRSWEQREPRLRVIRSPKLPLARAHNLAAAMARGALLARLDADDIARPARLERQVAMFAARSELGFAGSTVEVIDRASRRCGRIDNPLDHAAIAAALPSSCPIVHSSLMLRADLFRLVGGYRIGLNIAEDYDLYNRLIEHARAANAEAALVQYRVHAGGMTDRRTLRMAIANEAIRAAVAARRKGLLEPFIDGVPSLRRIAELRDCSRREVRRNVIATGLQSRTSRRLLSAGLPLQTNHWLRALALWFGFRPVYTALFRTRVALAELLGRRCVFAR